MLTNRAVWTVGGYGFSMAMRLGQNVILSRLLVPEILGILVVVSSIRIGFELLTDVGIEQNIVQNEKGLEPDFLNTAWTLQITRGICLTGVFLCLAPLLASLYGIDRRVFIFISLAPTLSSSVSTSIFALSKTLQVRKRNVFEMTTDFLNFVIFTGLAVFSPTVWAMVVGVLVSIGTRTALSYFIPHPPHRPTLRLAYVLEIVHFGKWITLSSFLLYVTGNLDRVYLGQMIPLGVLGIYGLAKTIAELPLTLTSRLTYQLVFPLLAGIRGQTARSIRSQMGSTRFVFILIAATVMATSAAWADWSIRVLYDRRYDQAGWMLFVLLLGGWPAVLSALNEAVLLGCGKPVYSSISNAVKFAVLAIGLPCGFLLFGLAGAIIATASSEIFRYLVLLSGQTRLDFSFLKQDAAATVLMIVVLTAWAALRAVFHLGAPWDGISV